MTKAHQLKLILKGISNKILKKKNNSVYKGDPFGVINFNEKLIES